MSDIRRRIKTAEKKLKLDEEPITVVIARYGADLPPDREVGGVTIHYVCHDERAKR